MGIAHKYQEKLRLEFFITCAMNGCDIDEKLGSELSETVQCHKEYYEGNPCSKEINGKPDVKDKHQKYGV